MSVPAKSLLRRMDADSCLQVLGLGAVEPHHDVRVRAHGGDVVAAPESHAALRELLREGFEFLGSIAAAQDVGRALEDSPEREELLFGFSSFSDRFGRSVAHGSSLPRASREVETDHFYKA